MSLDLSLYIEQEYGSAEVFEANITSNMGAMANTVGIYDLLWLSDQSQTPVASSLIVPLQAALDTLRADPDKFKHLNPDNGWGSHAGLVRFVEALLEACKEYPNATMKVNH